MSYPQLPGALRSVAHSCRVARSAQQALEQVRQITKDDRSPVTVADFAVQAIVALDLFEDDPNTLIVGEERADALRQDDQAAVRDAVLEAVRTVRPGIGVDEVLEAIDRCDHDGRGDAYWALDPIDGTKGFLRGQQYAVALGRIEEGRVVMGVMGCPNLPSDRARPLDEADPPGCIYAGVLDCGSGELHAEAPDGSAMPIEAATYREGQPIRVCESVEAAHSKHDDVERIVQAIGIGKSPVRLDSQCKYAVVARGQADAYLRLPTRKDYVEKIWDHAAGSLIASEAGAVVTDVTGAPLDFTRGRRLESNRGIVCAAPGLHERVIEVIDQLSIGAPV